MTTNDAAASQAANTEASGGSAGTTTSGSGSITSPTPVVAPKGFRLALQQMLQGWQDKIPSDSTIQSSAGNLTQAAVLAQLQGYLEAYSALDTNATATKKARAQVKSQLPEARTYYAVLKAAVANSFGAQSPDLSGFGVKPKKARAKAKSNQLAVRAAKAKATRTLRGTMGSLQKADLKSGPMTFVEPVAGTGAASTAPPDPAPSVASTPGK